jgi:small subunit ribosomal protein S17
MTSRAQTLQGEVVRRSGDKTVAVVVHRLTRHPLYQKGMRRSTTYLAHDPDNTAHVGDVVTIKAVRPLSARKRWLVVST